MSHELRLPELGENIASAVIVALRVKEGDHVEKDQVIAELESEKATVELPSPVSGVVEEILVSVGAEVKVGQVLMRIREVAAPQAETAPPVEAPQVTPPTPEKGPLPTPVATTPSRATVDEPPVLAGPATRLLARQLGVSIAEVKAVKGRVTTEDVMAHAKKLIELARGGGFDANAVDREPLSGVRRKTITAMTTAWATVPMVTTRDEADITELEIERVALSSRFEKEGVKLSATAILVKAAAAALRVFPRFNSSLDTAQNELVLRRSINIGVAVDAGHGLLVPVIKYADRKSLTEVATALRELADKARAKKLGIEEMKDATFTISNLGGLGTTDFSPIVNWPEVAILGVCKSSMKPMWDGSAFIPRLILPLCLTYDHRVIDGADAARFLRHLALSLEQPLALVL